MSSSIDPKTTEAYRSSVKEITQKKCYRNYGRTTAVADKLVVCLVYGIVNCKGFLSVDIV